MSTSTSPEQFIAKAVKIFQELRETLELSPTATMDQIVRAVQDVLDASAQKKLDAISEMIKSSELVVDSTDTAGGVEELLKASLEADEVHEKLKALFDPKETDGHSLTKTVELVVGRLNTPPPAIVLENGLEQHMTHLMGA